MMARALTLSAEFSMRRTSAIYPQGIRLSGEGELVPYRKARKSACAKVVPQNEIRMLDEQKEPEPPFLDSHFEA